MSEEYYLPEVEFAAVQCRTGELTEWLNHLNAVVQDLANKSSQYITESCCDELDQLEERIKAIEDADFATQIATLRNDLETTSIIVGQISATIAEHSSKLVDLEQRIEALEGNND